jgi:hypothetical protein
MHTFNTTNHHLRRYFMAVQDNEQNNDEQEKTYEYEPVYQPIEAQVPYEEHLVKTNGDGLLSNMFDAFEEVIAKPTVGLAKEIGSDAVELGSEVAAMVRSDEPQIHDVPDISPTAEIPQTMVTDIHMEPQRVDPAPEPAPVPAYEYDCSPDY